MIREACIGIMLSHPNIGIEKLTATVQLKSAVLGENHFYCLFEYAPGEDLVVSSRVIVGLHYQGRTSFRKDFKGYIQKTRLGSR